MKYPTQKKDKNDTLKVKHKYNSSRLYRDRGVYNMKKNKRLDLIATVVKNNRFNKKEEITDYIDTHFGVRYSVTTISRDLKKLKIFKVRL